MDTALNIQVDSSEVIECLNEITLYMNGISQMPVHVKERLLTLTVPNAKDVIEAVYESGVLRVSPGPEMLAVRAICAVNYNG